MAFTTTDGQGKVSTAISGKPMEAGKSRKSRHPAIHRLGRFRLYIKKPFRPKTPLRVAVTIDRVLIES
jgi:hypothetical protein